MLFVDTGPLLARYLVGDAYHRRALSTWKTLRGRRLFTSNYVLAETWTLLGRRAGRGFAAQRAIDLHSSPSWSILYADRDTDLAAIRLMEKYADQSMSFTDCVSFALMRQHRISQAFTFDHHFLLAGFEVVG